MSDNEAIKQQFLGPSCLYKVLHDRFEANPYLLRRNLRTAKDKRRRYRKVRSVAITTTVNQDTSYTISFFLLGKKLSELKLSPYNILKQESYNVQMNDNDAADFNQTFQFNEEILKPKEQFVSLCLLIVKSINSAVKDDLKTALAISKQLGTFDWKAHPARDDINIVIKRPEVSVGLLDILSLVGGEIFGCSNALKHTVNFRTFMLPLSSQQGTLDFSSSITYYRNREDPNLLSLQRNNNRLNYTIQYSSHRVPPSSNNSLLTLNSSIPLPTSTAPSFQTSSTTISPTATTPTLSTSMSYNLRPIHPSNSNPYEEKLIHYHLVTQDPQDMKSSHIEFYSMKYPFPQCIWCGYKVSNRKLYYHTEKKKLLLRSAKEMALLLHHMHCCHDHFQYELELDMLQHIHITIRRLRSTPVSYHTEHKESYLRGKSKQIPYKKFENLEFVGNNGIGNSSSSSSAGNGHSMLGQGQGQGMSSLTTASGKKNGHVKGAASKQTPTIAAAESKDYFHPQTGQQLSFDELLALSHKVDDGFEIKLQHQILDEFTDITAQEKEIMKLWNSHISIFPAYGDKLFPVVCERFVQRYANIIIAKNLRHNLLLHLMNLWDFGMLLSEEVYAYMHFVDTYAADQGMPMTTTAPSSSSSSSSSSAAAK